MVQEAAGSSPVSHPTRNGRDADGNPVPHLWRCRAPPGIRPPRRRPASAGGGVSGAGSSGLEEGFLPRQVRDEFITRTKYPDKFTEQIVHEILEKERARIRGRLLSAWFRRPWGSGVDQVQDGSSSRFRPRSPPPLPGQGPPATRWSAPGRRADQGTRRTRPLRSTIPGGNVGRGATTTLVGVSHEFIEAYSMNRVE